MGKHSITVSSHGQPSSTGTALSRTPAPTVSIGNAVATPVSGVPRPAARKTRRSPLVLPGLASFATAAMVLVLVVDPYSGTYASAALPSEWDSNQPTQTLVVADGYEVDVALDSYEIEQPPPPPPPVVVAQAPAASSSSPSSSSSSGAAAPVAGKPDPGSAKAIAADMVSARGWDSGQYNCLVSLWNKESGWNMYAQNKSSGAYGIPQALPGNKMASAGADWATNAATQISWGLGYISGRYQTPCGAWTHSQAVGWY
jgi:hypothetical protein